MNFHTFTFGPHERGPLGASAAFAHRSTMGGPGPSGPAGRRFRRSLSPRKLTGELAVHSFWTSSLVLGHTDHAHVFYGPLGGGGGAPEDHQRTRRHAVVMIKN